MTRNPLPAWRPLAPLQGWRRSIAAPAGSLACEVQVWRPQGVPLQEPLPVLYVLDGADLFTTVAETARRLARRPGATHVTPTMVVGIELADRDRTLHYTPGPAREELIAGRCGGAGALMQFLGAELMPAVERDFAAARRSLLGHSLAGYLALQMLAAQPSSCTDYIAVSPSLWWDEPALLAALDRARFSGQRVLLAHGQWEAGLAPWQRDQPGSAAMAERRRRRRMPARCRALAARLRQRTGLGAVIEQEFADEDHGSVVLVAAVRALRFAAAPCGVPGAAHGAAGDPQ